MAVKIKLKGGILMMDFILRTIIKIKFVGGFISYDEYVELMKKMDETV